MFGANQISVPQVIRVPQQKSALKTGQISWNNRSEHGEIANYHSPMHCNSFTCQFKGVKAWTVESRLDRVFLLRTLRYKVNFFEKLLWKMFVSSLVDWEYWEFILIQKSWLHEFWKVLYKIAFLTIFSITPIKGLRLTALFVFVFLWHFSVLSFGHTQQIADPNLILSWYQDHNHQTSIASHSTSLPFLTYKEVSWIW